MIIAVKLEGMEPGILFHNPANALRREKVGTRGSAIPSREAEAEASCYWSKDKKTLVFPGDNLIAAIAQTGAQWKTTAGRTRLGSFLSSCLKTDPDDISFDTTKYEIYEKRVVVQRQGILRSRALLFPWVLKFNLTIESEFFPLKEEAIFDTLRRIIEESGVRIGIGDWRPAKRGRFGRFKLTDWKLVK